MLVRDCMTSDPVTVFSGEDTVKVFEKMKDLNLRQFPVVDQGVLVGMITEHDLRTSLAKGENVKVSEIMSKDPITILDYVSVEGAAQIIMSRKFNALPVMSTNEELIGIVTVTDLLDSFLTMLRFHEKPVRIEVDLTEEFGLFDTLSVIQEHSEKVLSFSSAQLDRNKYYFWVLNCDFGAIDKILRDKKLGVRIINSST